MGKAATKRQPIDKADPKVPARRHLTARAASTRTMSPPIFRESRGLMVYGTATRLWRD